MQQKMALIILGDAEIQPISNITTGGDHTINILGSRRVLTSLRRQEACLLRQSLPGRPFPKVGRLVPHHR